MQRGKKKENTIIIENKRMKVETLRQGKEY